MNAKWHIINHLACAVVFLSVCSFSAFSQERDTIFIIEHDTVWMDPQPDTIIESQTRENRYDRRVHRYRRHWEALIPTHTKFSLPAIWGCCHSVPDGITAKETNGKQTYSSEYCPNTTPNVPS